MAIQLPISLAQTLVSAIAKPGTAAASNAASAGGIASASSLGGGNAVDSAQAAKFRALVQPDATVAGDGSGLAISAGHAIPAHPPASLGDAILQGLEKVRGSLNNGWASATALLDPQNGPVSTPRMLQFELGMLHMGFAHQMIGSVVSKTTQDIDQLVKMQ